MNTRLRASAGALAALAACAAVAHAQTTVNLAGLTQPTSVAWDTDGRVFVSEKAGKIKVAPSFSSLTAAVLIDITNQVTSYGDHGVTSLDYADGFLYATYSALNPATNNTCADRGQPNGRPPSAIEGCVVIGRLSRWPVVGGAVTGPEQILVGENSTARVCAQFATGPIDYALVGRDSAGRAARVYFSAGTGANTFTTDIGNMGTNPCGGGAQLSVGGAFRAQDGGSLDGKILSYDLTTRAVTPVAKGFNNPWRFALSASGGTVYVGDTGINMYEELSAISLGGVGTRVVQAGFPCFEGPGRLEDYWNASQTVCSGVAADPALVTPLYSYTAPNNATRVSISAVSTFANNGRVYYGDYSQSIIGSVKADGSDLQMVSGGPFWPVDMAEAPSPYGLVYVDIVRGAVKSLSVRYPTSGAPAAATASAAVAAAAVVAAVVAGAWRRDAL